MKNKYNLGDVLFFIHNAEVKSTTVRLIEKGGNTYVLYEFDGHSVKINETKCFPTKKDLLASL